MAYTLGDITTKVRLRIRDSSYNASEIHNYINDTQNDVFNEYRLRFMKTSQNYTVTAGESDITNGSDLPTNYVQAIKLINTTEGQEEEIHFIDENKLDEMYPDKTDSTRWANGQPLYCYDDGETIRLFPAPADAYTLKLRYYKRPTLLNSDDNVPEIPSEFEELLVAGAAYRVLQVKDNYDQAAIHENKYQELLQKLVVRYSRPNNGQVAIMGINRGGPVDRELNSWRRIP